MGIANLEPIREWIGYGFSAANPLSINDKVTFAESSALPAGSGRFSLADSGQSIIVPQIGWYRVSVNAVGALADVKPADTAATLTLYSDVADTAAFSRFLCYGLDVGLTTTPELAFFASAVLLLDPSMRLNLVYLGAITIPDVTFNEAKSSIWIEHLPDILLL